MNRTQLAIVGVALATSLGAAVAAEPFNYRPPNGVVPDANTAARIAEAVMTPIMGLRQVRAEEPFRATLSGDVWHVYGDLHCPKPHECVGGVAEVDISKTDGRVLRISHGQ